MKKALICIDFINEIIHSKGKLSGKGYVNFSQENNSISHIQKLVSQYREEGDEVIHVRICFNEDYSNQPKESLLFGKAHEFWILQENTWSTEFLEELQPEVSEKVITKRRVSIFYNTELHDYLQSQNITDLTIIWVATDLAVESAVRDAHDRDYNITVVSNSCIAANMKDHEKSLKLMEKIAKVI
jgi:nicotinamidase-related amidase